MDIFSLDEIISRIVIALDLNSILELRLVNRQLSSVVSGCTPLLCERDQLPVVNSFFRWALMHSQSNSTRYSHLFSRDECIIDHSEEHREVLKSLIEKRQFKTAAEYVTHDMLNEEMFTFLFNELGDDNAFMNWVKKIVVKLDDEDYDCSTLAFIAALEHKDPARMISRLWSKRMNLTKGRVLNLVTEVHSSTIDLFYSIESLYPNLQHLEEDLESAPRSWIMQTLSQTVNGYGSASPTTLLYMALKNEDFDLCGLILESGLNYTDYLINSCTTPPALKWLCDNMYPPNRGGREIVIQALKIGCTPDGIQYLLHRYNITEIGMNELLAFATFFQFDVLLPLLKEDWYRINIPIGYLLLLNHYDSVKFSLAALIETDMVPYDVLESILERKIGKINWDKLVRLYIYTKPACAKTLSLLLQKDMEVNDFADGLPSRWIHK